MWQLPFKLPEAHRHFFLIDTGRPSETTGDMVSYVKSRIQQEKSKFEKIFNENEAQTRAVATAIKEENEKELINAIQRGERSLEDMGVVSDVAIPLIRGLEQSGGAAKILGGGGRSGAVGYVLGYHRHIADALRIAKRYGCTIQPIELGEEGIRLEKK
jgi:mevalonate kinase